MAEITITIRADEDDLTAFVGPMHEPRFSGAEHRLRHIVIAALPKPRIVVKPGMVLRYMNGDRAFAYEDDRGDVLLILPNGETIDVMSDGCVSDDWAVLLNGTASGQEP